MSKSKKRVAKKVQPVAAKVETAPMSERGQAISKSWADKAVAKARVTRHKVRVGRTEYSSCRAAFKALDLTPGRCISFRGKLKAAGKLAFTDDSGKQTMFTIVAD
jgi:hypothetical protein